MELKDPNEKSCLKNMPGQGKEDHLKNDGQSKKATQELKFKQVTQVNLESSVTEGTRCQRRF